MDKIKKILPYIIGLIVVFIISWYLAVKFAIVAIAFAIGFISGVAWSKYKTKTKNENQENIKGT